MVKTLKRYQIIEVEEHELLPGMTRITKIVDEERLTYIQYLALCIEHLHTLFIEDDKSESVLRTLIPMGRCPPKSTQQTAFKSLIDLLKTGSFASPTPLQLVTKYIPNLSQPEPYALEKMSSSFDKVADELPRDSPYIIKKIGSQYWLLKKREK